MKKLNFVKIDALNPDLILGNKEENEKEQITLLEKKHPVWMSNIQNIAQALECIRHLGEITGEVTTEDKLDYIFSKFCIGK